MDIFASGRDHPRLGGQGKGTALSIADIMRGFLPGSIEAGLNRAYGRSLRHYGATPQAVFWNSRKSQEARFAALLAMVSRDLAAKGRSDTAPVIADIGCGYGAMLDYMRARPGLSSWGYQGVDINAAMIRECRTRFASDKPRFTLGRTPASVVDYAVFSGTFNLCLIADEDRWPSYIIDCLAGCWPHCRRGMALNLLCRKQTGVSNRIYYADRDHMVRALSRFGRVEAMPTVGVKHDVSFLVTR